MQANTGPVRNVAAGKEGEKMNDILAACLLTIYSYYDLKERRIPIKGLLAGLILSIGCIINQQHKEIGYYLIMNSLPAVFISLLAFLSRDQIGYGDGAVLLILGICIGMTETVAVLFIAFFLCSVWGMIHIALKRGNLKSKYAFVPFLCIGFLMVWVTKIWK